MCVRGEFSLEMMCFVFVTLEKLTMWMELKQIVCGLLFSSFVKIWLINWSLKNNNTINLRLEEPVLVSTFTYSMRV